ncbi:hypothetical protein RUMLAC_02540 [[Ruminococcus] lactaris ATCC 29176]|uniref:Uncharacterized protein n=1 Tax=[Ruminococcus] lactaris ATCC 29176 TaxID=471875 RepID=B5CSV6_9FIRM|nr:hypothetical protein RUMLAC_02540 [[Ruminococcus] lactaris ATCC 29176]
MDFSCFVLVNKFTVLSDCTAFFPKRQIQEFFLYFSSSHDRS